MNKRYTLVVFDWDGTLMDSEARIVACMQHAALDAGWPVPSVALARDVIGLGLKQAIQRLFPGVDRSDEQRLIEGYRTHWMGEGLEPAFLFAGAQQLVHDLHVAGYLLAVATGKSRRGLDKSLVDSGLIDLFHATRCADETFSKPHPQMLEELLTDLNTPPADALMIGDTVYDVQMARNARTDAVGMAHGVHSGDRLLAEGALACFGDLTSLAHWLGVSFQEKQVGA